jgi:threonine aldolase
MIDRTCAHARRFADGLTAAGYDVLNDVVLNQVMVSFGTPQTTRRVMAAVQEDGTCWCGPTEWRGRTAMRISVSSWATTREDIDKSLAAILRIAATAQTFRDCNLLNGQCMLRRHTFPGGQGHEGQGV